MFIVHVPFSPFGGSRSPADRQPHMLFGCHTCAESGMGLQAAIAVCKFCAPRICSCDFLIVQEQFQLRCRLCQAPVNRQIIVVLASCIFSLFRGQQTENPQNP